MIVPVDPAELKVFTTVLDDLCQAERMGVSALVQGRALHAVIISVATMVRTARSQYGQAERRS